ncbi:putative ATPase/DNA-binding SARP family transcriptional activator [Nocardia transvalensis]|uniref:Putative ATPase/DNA-binding SARP family transcriptional activator n=1 Tax=Nocardia transvalensis TaxID=37333 RepID=A0A7W9PE63_9NOCA|nr:BTAD domain-containing putative transcriptional regulator [Nocardia transvalensis]MBB5914442.1 putative ATPase/DNA-binding SARP family transcriptional activator [Nocardia transvalensis]
MFPDHSGSTGAGTTHTRSGTNRDENLPGARILVALLGEIAVRKDGELTAVPGARARLLVAALAAHPGRSRSAQALIDEVWGEQPPRAPMNALHTQVSRLRSVLPEGALEIGPAGYRLVLPEGAVDLSAARLLEREARDLLDSGDAAGCLERIARARRLWRGEPGSDLPSGPVADELGELAAARWNALDGLELAAREEAGDLAGATAVARRAALAQPLDEPAHGTLMRLLAADGRSNEALEVFATLRKRLGDELGADPGPALVTLNTAILRGEPMPEPARARPAASRTPVQLVSSAQHALTPESGDGHAERPAPPLLSTIGLRAAPNPLLGREADLDALERSLRTSRAVTVLGPGGTGKTRVANELGARVGGEQPVAMVELASLRADPDGLAATCAEIEAAIGATLGMSEYSRETKVLRPNQIIDGRRRLREALSLRPMLLILDNCEHLIDAVAEVVADLVGACDQLTVLATSRAPLAITAETVYPLPPLAIDAHGSPATDLFVARARAVRPSVRLEPEAVARLCRTLDGLPLAIELAAARVRTMSVEEIEARLEHRFALLRSGDRTSPERHRTLHAVIEWSWNLLDPEQQIALRRLCRFPAGFTLAAAEFVAGGDGVIDPMGAVEGLVSQSLLTVLEGDDEVGTRYRMLETVREFGEEQLIDGEADLVMDRMCGWAREFVVDVARRYQTQDQVEVVLSVAAELDNLLAVLRYALDTEDAETVYSVFAVVATLWVMRGGHMELMNWAPRLLAVAPPTGERTLEQAALEMQTYLTVGAHLMFGNAGLRALAIIRGRTRRLLNSTAPLTPMARYFGELICLRPDVSRLGRKLAEGARSPDDDVRAVALMLRANMRENNSDVYGSTQDAIQVLKIVEPHDVWSTAMACQHLGQMSSQQAHYRESAGYYRRAVDLLVLLHSYEEAVEIRTFLAVALVGAGEPVAARTELEFALGMVDDGTDLDDPVVRPNHRRGMVVSGLAELELAEGEIERGLRTYRKSLELFDWPLQQVAPGPGDILIGAAVLDAHVLHDRLSEVPALPAQLIDETLARLAQYFDLPQIGAVACAIGTYLVATGKNTQTGLSLLALAPKVVGRQDMPSMRWNRHLALHRPVVGEEALENVRRALPGLSRRVAAERVMRMLGEVLDTVRE